MYTTTTTLPTTSSPSDTNRRSSSAVGSSRLIAFGSMSTASASEKRIPCFPTFAWAFFGSQAAVTYVLYAYNRAGRQRRPLDGPTSPLTCKRATYKRPRSGRNSVDRVSGAAFVGQLHTEATWPRVAELGRVCGQRPGFSRGAYDPMKRRRLQIVLGGTQSVPQKPDVSRPALRRWDDATRPTGLGGVQIIPVAMPMRTAAGMTPSISNVFDPPEYCLT